MLTGRKPDRPPVVLDNGRARARPQAQHRRADRAPRLVGHVDPVCAVQAARQRHATPTRSIPIKRHQHNAPTTTPLDLPCLALLARIAISRVGLGDVIGGWSRWSDAARPATRRRVEVIMGSSPQTGRQMRRLSCWRGGRTAPGSGQTSAARRRSLKLSTRSGAEPASAPPCHWLAIDVAY